jgi:putative transcriptional regulator
MFAERRVVLPPHAGATLAAMNSTHPATPIQPRGHIRRVAVFAAFLLVGLLPAAQAADLGAPLVLVAKPELRDAVFGGTVLLVIPLGADQHAGFIVNRPTMLTLGKVFPEHGPSQKVADPVYLGGPVESELIFALVRRKTTPGGKSFQIAPGVFAAYEAAVVDRIIESEPQTARFMAGFVAWKSGELRAEIEAGAWFIQAADAALLTRRPEGLWEDLVRRVLQAWNAI